MDSANLVLIKLLYLNDYILKRLYTIIFKSALIGLPCISSLSANTVFYKLSIFCWNFFNFGSALKVEVTCINVKLSKEKYIDLYGFRNTSKLHLFEFALNVKVFLK